MRWLELVVICSVAVTVLAEPEPKKYMPEVKTKVKEATTNLTNEERQFLREVEAKFGIKSDVTTDSTEDVENSTSEENDSKKPNPQKLPFPAVIAIEIVNDTDSKTKGKRTIDANLGYGYRTNNGYTYTYFGKSGEERGKFMIYPYSQEDIPAKHPSASSYDGYPKQSGHTTKLSPNVEITPSQAYELLPAKEEDKGYNYEKPSVQLNTKYENVHSVESPPPPYPVRESSSSGIHPSTLYTTYNGEHFSSLSGQFPKVMSNYLVDPSQLLTNPSYQSAGLTQDHLRPHEANLGQRVVPVLVLRIPSSYIKNPSAELYANVPQNYPLSQYLNHVNLQELVNQYFKKIGYAYAPKVMAYSTSSLSQTSEPASPPAPSYEPQHYASPYVQPSYTHADYSGVQYSAVQPVMAKYPAGYARQQYYIMRPHQSYYRQPQQQQQYVYRYKYVPQSATHASSYYTEPQYHQEVKEEHVNIPQSNEHETPNQVEYSHQSTTSEEEQVAVEYEQPQSEQSYTFVHQPQSESKQEYAEHQQVTESYETATSASPSYEHEVSTPDYGPTKLSLASHGSSPSVQVQYEQSGPKDSISVFPRSQIGHNSGIAQSYVYQNVNDQSNGHGLVLEENYPSKDHTIATVLPISYKKKQHTEPVQSVSYVTPEPTMKYHSHYRVMVPQTILRRPTNEKVTYVNSHSLSSTYLSSGNQYNPEEEYTVSNHYVPPIGKQKSSSYPRNYHAHPKRMAKPEIKSDTTTSPRKSERADKKKSTMPT